MIHGVGPCAYMLIEPLSPTFLFPPFFYCPIKFSICVFRPSCSRSSRETLPWGAQPGPAPRRWQGHGGGGGRGRRVRERERASAGQHRRPCGGGRQSQAVAAAATDRPIGAYRPPRLFRPPPRLPHPSRCSRWQPWGWACSSWACGGRRTKRQSQRHSVSGGSILYRPYRAGVNWPPCVCGRACSGCPC